MREAVFSDRYYDLYARYIDARHADGDMYPPNVDQFRSFLLSSWSNSAFLVLEEAGRLIGVAVTDHVPDGLSAIYTFFDPTLSKRSIGVLAVLAQIEHCLQQRDSVSLSRLLGPRQREDARTRSTIAPSNYWSGTAGFASPDTPGRFAFRYRLRQNARRFL